ncbi:MAG: DUF3306 domain-containing protein [Rubrivivax sp.]|nr:DUF3306 domain-containing protein [Rubrivivax sp.]
MSAADDDGFLSRWARRKADARRGTDPTPMHTASLPPALAAQPTPAPALPVGPATDQDVALDPVAPAPAPPTWDDVAGLTKESDYTRFVAGDVDPGLRNAAMKKLFSDPHFNVMDGLDTYIDDYGKPDPLPPGMLRELAQSHFLGLFDDEPQGDPALLSPSADPTPATDENPDLQLQPDDAAGPEPGKTGREDPGEHAAGER